LDYKDMGGGVELCRILLWEPTKYTKKVKLEKSLQSTQKSKTKEIN